MGCDTRHGGAVGTHAEGLFEDSGEVGETVEMGGWRERWIRLVDNCHCTSRSDGSHTDGLKFAAETSLGMLVARNVMYCVT